MNGNAYDLLRDHVFEEYETLIQEHWFRLHRAGAVMLVAQRLRLPEHVVYRMINEQYGEVPLDDVDWDI